MEKSKARDMSYFKRRVVPGDFSTNETLSIKQLSLFSST